MAAVVCHVKARLDLDQIINRCTQYPHFIPRRNWKFPRKKYVSVFSLLENHHEKINLFTENVLSGRGKVK